MPIASNQLKLTALAMIMGDFVNLSGNTIAKKRSTEMQVSVRTLEVTDITEI